MRRFIGYSIIFVMIIVILMSGCSVIAEERLDWPESGEYICSDCGSVLRFSGMQIELIYAEGSSEMLHMDYGATVHGSDTRFMAFFSWNKTKNTVQLKIRRDYSYFKKGEKHIFYCS